MSMIRASISLIGKLHVVDGINVRLTLTSKPGAEGCRPAVHSPRHLADNNDASRQGIDDGFDTFFPRCHS